MKAKEITDELIEAIKSGKYDFLRVNYPNGDMVGHTGVYEAAKTAVEFMDKCLKRVYDKVQELDGILIITADHGMDMRRGHGDGNPECTRTPFVTWGSGIREAIYRDKKPDDEDTPSDWLLDNYVRHDISQIDITPLIAGLLGTNFPMNSLGILPLNMFSINDKIKSKLLYGNMMELFELYKIKDDIESKAMIYKTFEPLTDYNNLMKNIVDNIDKGNYKLAINETYNFINLTLQGIDYILHYDRIYLKTIVSLGYISWMIYLIIFIKMKNEDVLNKFFFYNQEEKTITIVFIVILVVLYTYLILRLSPILHFVYTLFPCYFLWRISVNINYLKSFFFFSDDIKKILIHFVYYIFTILAFLFNKSFSLI